MVDPVIANISASHHYYFHSKTYLNSEHSKTQPAALAFITFLHDNWCVSEKKHW